MITKGWQVLTEVVDHIKNFCELYDGSYKDAIIEYHGNGIEFIEPVFNRDGFYYNRITKQCFIEVFGLAFTRKCYIGSFKYSLERLNSRHYTDRELKAMQELLKMNSLSKSARLEMHQALYDHDNRKQLINIKKNCV